MESIDINYIQDKIQTILNRAHTNERKRMINDRQHDRLRFACPICGDSSTKMDEKRGYLYMNNLYYRCYNEDCRSTFTGLCKKFDIELDIKDRLKISNFIDVQLSLYHKRSDDALMANFDKLIPKEDFMSWANGDKSPFMSLTEPKFGSSVFVYLKKRGFSDDQIANYFYQATKMTPWGKIEPYIVFLNIKDDKIVGMQERNIQSGQYRRYKIWSFSELYERVYDDSLELEEEIGYNKLSYLFNIFNVDFSRRVTLFEGYIDSLFYQNSIGAVGIHTDFDIFIRNDIDVQFFFDYDDIGIYKASELLKKGHKVFLWENLLEDLSKKTNDPYKYALWFRKNIKDLNNLLLLTDVKAWELDKYFTDNPAYLMKLKKRKKKKEEINIHNYKWKL